MAETEKKGGALATFAAAGLPSINSADAAAALIAGTDDATTSGGDRDFLTYSGKSRRWALGRDKYEPDPDAVFVVDPRMATTGWVCWKGGKAVKKHQWNMIYERAKAVSYDTLEDYGPYKESAGEGWFQSLGVSLFEVDGPERHVEFTTTSVSGRNALGALTSEAGQLWKENGEPMMAVITLDDETFEAQGQVNGKPVFNVLAWATEAEVQAFLADEDGDVDRLIEGGYAEIEEEAPPAKPTGGRKGRRKAA